MAELFGVWPALVTPFTADNEINTTAIVKLVEYHLGKDVNGFYVCGSTGSGIFQSVAERKLVVETTMSVVGGQVPVIVHVGAVSLKDAIELGQHAQAHGAAGFSSIIPPLYPDLESIVRYYTALAQAVPGLPFFPYIARPQIDAFDLVQRLMVLPNMAGTKYTGPNMYEFGQIVALRDEHWTVFAGMDEQSVFAAMSGAGGHIGSTLNFMPGAYAQIRAHLAAEEYKPALELQKKANAVTRQLLSFDFWGALYETMSMLGFECGQPRLPGMPLTSTERDAFHANLEAAHFWDLAAM